MNGMVARREGISIIDLLATLARRKWIVIGVTSGVGIVAFAFLMATSRLPVDSRWNLYPDYFQPTVKVVIQESSNVSGLSQLLQGSNLGNLVNLAGLGSLQGRSNPDFAQALIKTAPVLDPIVEEFRIIERNHIVTSPRTKARKAIVGGISTKYDVASGILSIGFRDTDRVFATQVVTRLVEVLQSQFQRLTLDQVMSRRSLLEAMVAEQTIEADKASQALIAFQNTYGILDVATQMSETTAYLAQLQSQLTAKQLELKVLRKYYPETDARIVQGQGQIEELQRLIEAVRVGSPDYTIGVTQKQLPALRQQYATLNRNMEIQQQLLAGVMQQLELNRLEENNTARLFQIVEPAEVPEVKAGPPRTTLLLVAVFAAGLVSLVLAFVVDFFARQPAGSEDVASIRALRDALRLRPRRRSPVADGAEAHEASSD